MSNMNPETAVVTPQTGTSQTVPTIAEHIVITPGTCGGKPRIAGHRIKVQHIVIAHDRGGLTPHEIVAHYEGINLADVYAALAYYHDHRAEIDADIQHGEQLYDELKKKQPSIVEKAKQRLAQQQLGDPSSP
jgi:uncharacterized protein (DUF433 family)